MCAWCGMRASTTHHPNSVYFLILFHSLLELLAQFIRHHTILVRDDDDDDDGGGDDDDDNMFIPTADHDDEEGGRHSSMRLRKVNCYQQLLHRIRHRQYYTTTTNNNNNDAPHTTAATFVIEIPCMELIRYNPALYTDLVHDRIIPNAMRYHEIVCTVLDQLLAEIPLSRNHDDEEAPRNVEDILYDQRLTLQQQQQQQPPPTTEEADAAAAAALNPYQEPRGPLEEEEEAAANAAANAKTTNLTADFPPLLMRRYELRILPVGRKGIYPPFSQQYHHHHFAHFQKDLTDDLTTTTIVPTSIRNVRAHCIGRLVTITGMIVRVSDVKPILQVAAYACDYCGAEIYQTVQHQKEFLPATACPLCCTTAAVAGGPQRRIQRSKGNTLYLQTRGSKFVKYQEVKVQELSHHVPMGHVPRSIAVVAYGECTRQCTPGDTVTLDGIYLPQRIGGDSGYQAMKAGLITTTYLHAQNIMVHKKSYDETKTTTAANDRPHDPADPDDDPTARNDIVEAILAIARGPDPIGRLSSSLAPEIFGHADIKRALLLQLVSGCTRTLPDGMRIRGDINILLMGDPGVAKSQLLKHVATIAPRGVYTTGKGSSGVGLTAAVTRDTTTNEMTLEGGALVFADRGICCIDEFDKMDESDRTAIHEVMEQQTVSIAKAGIVATLNARASVLAAANPIYGRYNPYKSLSDNIALPNSLLSRFDLIFLILDIADIDKDMALAKHVTYVHQMEGQKQYELQNGMPLQPPPESIDSDDRDTAIDADGSNAPPKQSEDVEPVSSLILREYISRARQYHPVVPPDVAPYIVEAYVSLRMQQQNGSHNRRRSNYGGNNSNNSNDQTVMTARQLLSTLRLSQAIARLRFSNVVAREDVDEAIRLTHMSKANLHTMQDNHRSGGGGNNHGGRGSHESTDATSKIFHILRDYCTITKQSHMDIPLCEAMILRKGYTKQQLNECLTEYESLDIIQYNQTKTQIQFI